jgi:peptide/nickel transport system ATP-binding protein
MALNESWGRPGVTDQQPLLDVRDLETQFLTRHGVVHAVNGVSMQIREGELVGLVGETGSGKSAMVRSIIGLIRKPGRVVSGEVLFQDLDLRTSSANRLRRVRGRGIGFVPQNPFAALHPVVKLEQQFENVIRAHRDISRAECRTLAEQVLGQLAISDPRRVLNGYAHELSGGMAQRVVIGLALALDPPLVIADEPTTGLDVTVQRQLLDLISELLQRDRRAMLLVTHDLGIVAQYCNRVVVMYAGTVVESGPVREVFLRPAHPYTRALLDAVPDAGRPLTILGGSIPNLVHYPEGCAFHDRCAFAFDRCKTERPALRVTEGARERACHLSEDLADAGRTDKRTVA